MYLDNNEIILETIHKNIDGTVKNVEYIRSKNTNLKNNVYSKLTKLEKDSKLKVSKLEKENELKNNKLEKKNKLKENELKNTLKKLNDNKIHLNKKKDNSKINIIDKYSSDDIYIRRKKLGINCKKSPAKYTQCNVPNFGFRKGWSGPEYWPFAVGYPYNFAFD